MSEDHTDSDSGEEKDRQSSNDNISQGEQKEEASFRQDEEEEMEEDYEEVVLKPRPLNEVTSLTDRTSPWTSILSDPDLVSVESNEAPKDSDLSEDEEEKRQEVNLETHRENDLHHSSDGSEGRASGTERNDEKTLQEAEIQPEELKSPIEWSGDTSSSAAPSPDPDTHDVSEPQDNENTELQTYP